MVNVKSEGTDTLSKEMEAMQAQLDDHEARLTAIESGGTGPTPPNPEPGGDPWPSGWDDPRFTNMREETQPQGGDLDHVSIKTESGNPATTGKSIKFVRAQCREGPRIGPGSYLLEDIYIECGGAGDDHADGLQVYCPGERPVVVMRRFKIVMIKGANNAGWFAADKAEADITLEDGYIDGTEAGGAHGALWLPVDSKNADFGCKKFSGKSLVLKGQKHRNPFEPGPSYAGIQIVRWENIRDENGTPIPKPF